MAASWHGSAESGAPVDHDVLEALTRDSRARRRNPHAFLVVVVRHYWTESTAQEATRLWRATVRDDPGYAIEVLVCLHRVVSNPPADLVRLIVDHGRRVVHDTARGRRAPDDVAAHMTWLQVTYAEWHAILAAAVPDLDLPRPRRPTQAERYRWRRH